MNNQNLMPKIKGLITPIPNGSVQTIKGLGKDRKAKVIEKFLSFEKDKVIHSQEIFFSNGEKATFNEKMAGGNIFRSWKHSDKANLKIISNKDGDVLAFKASGYSWDMSGKTPEKTTWRMTNKESAHRKDIELSRVKNVFQGILTELFDNNRAIHIK